MADSTLSKRGRGDDSEQKLDLDFDFDYPECKRRLRDDLLSYLDDSVCDNPDLDLFLKSFEEEDIPVSQKAIEFSDLHPDLGYLLEASDDELGLPPSSATPNTTEVVEVVSGNDDPEEVVGPIGEMCSADEQIPSCEIGVVVGDDDDNNKSCGGDNINRDEISDSSDAPVVESAETLE